MEPYRTAEETVPEPWYKSAPTIFERLLWDKIVQECLRNPQGNAVDRFPPAVTEFADKIMTERRRRFGKDFGRDFK